MRKIIYMLSLPLLLAGLSCTKQIPDYGKTATVNASNGWWAQLYVGTTALLPKPAFFSTYNTSGNSTDSLWIDDLKNGYGFKIKAGLNYGAMTFTATNAANAYYVGTPAFPATVTLTDGKILPKAGHSLSGVAVDSIYMKAIFSDDPTTTYIVAGTARTGLAEDDY